MREGQGTVGGMEKKQRSGGAMSSVMEGQGRCEGRTRNSVRDGKGTDVMEGQRAVYCVREGQGTMGGKDKEQWEGSTGNSGREAQGTVGGKHKEQ